jgi:hypothetical protein
MKTSTGIVTGFAALAVIAGAAYVGLSISDNRTEEKTIQTSTTVDNTTGQATQGGVGDAEVAPESTKSDTPRTSDVDPTKITGESVSALPSDFLGTWKNATTGEVYTISENAINYTSSVETRDADIKSVEKKEAGYQINLSTGDIYFFSLQDGSLYPTISPEDLADADVIAPLQYTKQ